MKTATHPESPSVPGESTAKQTPETSGTQQVDDLDLAALSKIAGGMNKNDLIVDTSKRPSRV
jgi:hypothetical protein